MPAGGRHAAKHRILRGGARRRRPVGAALGVVLIVLLGTAAGVAGPRIGAVSCAFAGRVQITIAASPDIAGPLKRLARRWEDTGPRALGRCASARVYAKKSYAVTAALTPSWDSSRDGPRPDVWVPQSSAWVQLAGTRPETAPLLYGEQTVLTRSPVVMAMPKPMAQALGWPGAKVGWRELASRAQGGDDWAAFGHAEWGDIQLGMSDPSRSTAGLSALIALADSNQDGKIQASEVENLYRLQSVVAKSASSTDELLKGLRKADKKGKALGYVSAFPATERTVIKYDARSPHTSLAAIYPSEDVPDADYPFCVLNASWVNDPKRAAAALFRTFMLSPEGQHVFEHAGFRPAEGGELKGVGESDGVLPKEATTLRQAPDDSVQLARSVATWNGLRRPLNVLTVIDVSGSMRGFVPTANATKLALVKHASLEALKLFGGDSKVGLWEFSTGLTENHDYRELVPYGPVNAPVGGSSRKQALEKGIRALRPRADTALYDTTLAAYQRMLDFWQPGRLNVVVFLTDGENDDPQRGISRQDLLDKLQKLRDPDHPVQIATIAYGEDADRKTLAQISKTTGGRSFVAEDPKDLSRVFLTMLASPEVLRGPQNAD
ncbi:MAG: substrate-binding and VWA domain-containing protein [Streptosporangiaceae bacterium]